MVNFWMPSCKKHTWNIEFTLGNDIKGFVCYVCIILIWIVNVHNMSSLSQMVIAFLEGPEVYESLDAGKKISFSIFLISLSMKQWINMII